MTQSTKQTDIKIIEKVLELIKSKKSVTRKQLRDCVLNFANELKVNASYILEVIELKFDKFLKVA